MDENIDSQTAEQQDTRNCNALGFGHLQFPDDRSWDTQNHDINDDSRNTIEGLLYMSLQLWDPCIAPRNMTLGDMRRRW